MQDGWSMLPVALALIVGLPFVGDLTWWLYRILAGKGVPRPEGLRGRSGPPLWCHVVGTLSLFAAIALLMS